MNATNFDKRNLLKYVGDLSQLFGIKEYHYAGGKAKGVKAFDVKTGSGLEFTVLADRCLDIAGLSFKGTNCSYIGHPGIVAPEFYQQKDLEFLRSFAAGFLTTCGLRNVGSPCEQDGEAFGLHGRISNTPAEEVCATTEWVGGVPVFTLSGSMREARVFGENLVLKRKIVCQYGENKIRIHNMVENMGFRKEALMVLFHFNMGYPLLDENAVLLTPTRELIPRDAVAEQGKATFQKSQQPTPNYQEQVFYHNLDADPNGNTCVALINPNLELGVAIHFNKTQLFNFGQWKQMGEGEYVMGLEPGNCYVGGRVDPRNEQVLQYLEPGEVQKFDLTIEFLSGTQELEAIIQQIKPKQ